MPQQLGTELLSYPHLDISFHLLGEILELNTEFWSLIKMKMKSRNENNKFLDTWLEPIQFQETKWTEDRPKIVLSVPNALHQYFVVENLQDKIYAEISESFQKSFEVEFVISGSMSQIQESFNPFHDALKQSSQNMSQESGGQNQQQAQAPASAPHVSNPPMVKYGSDPLNPEFTFSTFVVGKNSEFAHAACYNVARSPGADDYNPLVIYGPVGMGKTHLLQAAGNYIRNNFPDVKIAYISAERFLNECVSAIRRHEMDKFRQKYRETADIILVDDLQYIGRGDAVKEEFFHTINAFIERKKQVILATDRMPKDIIGLEDRSRTRLERGLIADITMPDLETRIAILRYKAEKLQVRMPEDVVHYIAKISKRSIRELEGNLKKVKMFSEFQGLAIDQSLARTILANHESQTTVSVEDIQKLVSEHFKVKISDLKSSSRAKPIVIPRQISMYLIKKYLDRSLVDIGKHFGGKDHTTVINALERVTYLQESDKDIAKEIEDLETQIHNITGL